MTYFVCGLSSEFIIHDISAMYVFDFLVYKIKFNIIEVKYSIIPRVSTGRQIPIFPEPVKLLSLRERTGTFHSAGIIYGK